MSSILEKITEQTKEDLEKRRRSLSMRDFDSFPLFEKNRMSMAKALDRPGNVSIIAEVKKASPSKGLIREDFDPIRIARKYMTAGAAAISVLTDEPFFQGSVKYLENISKISTVPLLRKDFIIDPYQVKEARAYGADAVLIIATICDGGQMDELLSAAREYELDTLVECYHSDELDALNWSQVEIVGVNNRNLATFEVDLHRGLDLLQKAPDGVVRVSESGIHKTEDIRLLAEAGIHAALIGEHLMKQPDPGQALKELLRRD